MSDYLQLTNSCALVTGAGKGIGRACASMLAKAGANVIAVARTEADLKSLVKECPGQIEIWVEDVCTDDFVKKVSSLERLDVLVNNVGANRPQAFLEVDTETLDHIIAINVRAAFLVAQAAAKVMVKQGSGSIINMSSQMGHVGSPTRTVYCMTKHAIEGLTKAMAVELAAQGVRVNAVAPTYIDTPLTRPMFENKEFLSQVLSHMPMAKLGEPDDVANAVLFLASPVSKMITGDSLKVDGGWTAH